MKYEDMETSALLERRNAIAQEIEKPDADLDALEIEARAISAELMTRRANENKRQEARAKIAGGAGAVIEKREDKQMEVRNSREYIDAFASYVKTGSDKECRALLTTELAANGVVPVPSFVEDFVKTAWETNGVTRLISKTEIQGVLRVPFELSATGAEWHDEGGAAVTDETLTLGVVTLTPKNIKKVLPISDEVMDLTSEEFLRYVYDEITYRIAKGVEERIVEIISELPTTATDESVSAQKITAAPGVGVIAQAIGALSGEAVEPTIVMNKATWAAFKAAQYEANFAMDIFEGLNVVFSSALPAYATAESGAVYAIVGDFGRGFRGNYPKGEGVRFVYDDVTESAKDVVRIVGRQYVGLGAVAINAFANIAKA